MKSFKVLLSGTSPLLVFHLYHPGCIGRLPLQWSITLRNEFLPGTYLPYMVECGTCQLMSCHRTLVISHATGIWTPTLWFTVQRLIHLTKTSLNSEDLYNSRVLCCKRHALQNNNNNNNIIDYNNKNINNNDKIIVRRSRKRRGERRRRTTIGIWFCFWFINLERGNSKMSGFQSYQPF